MKKQPSMLSVAIFFATIILMSACKKEEDDTTPTPTPTTNTTSCNVVLVTSNIDVPTTWSKDSIYIIEAGDYIVVDATLTIEAGTIIKFKNTAGMNTRNGSIQAIGTASNPIIFTAFSDDDYCGDTNGDGAASVPTKGFWGGIRLQSAIPSNLTYCKILYTGASNANAAGVDIALRINADSDGSAINHCTFAHTSGGSSNSRGTVYFEEVYNCTFTNNIFYDNGSIICADYCATANFIDASNIFHNPNDASQKNVLQGIYLNRTNGGFFKNTQLHVSEVPYVLLGITGCGISDGIKVTLADNVIVKFMAGLHCYINSASNSGFINAQGSGVLFTSASDDTGGDSNGDGNLTSPANGDWVGIYDDNISGNDKWCHWSNILYDSH